MFQRDPQVLIFFTFGPESQWFCNHKLLILSTEMKNVENAKHRSDICHQSDVRRILVTLFIIGIGFEFGIDGFQ